MKTSDYVTVGLVAIIMTAIAYFLVNSLLGDPSEKSVRFEYLAGFESQLVDPDPELFNAAAINPTVEVYIGSCEDSNQDGKLDNDERRACGMELEEDDDMYSEGNDGLSDKENDAINNQQNYARGTTAQQRQAVEDSVNQYQQTQNQNNQQQNAENTAKRETVSGS